MCMCDGTKEEGTKNVTETQTGKDGFVSLLRFKGVEDFDQGMRIVSRNERRPFSSLSLIIPSLIYSRYLPKI